ACCAWKSRRSRSALCKKELLRSGTFTIGLTRLHFARRNQKMRARAEHGWLLLELSSQAEDYLVALGIIPTLVEIGEHPPWALDAVKAFDCEARLLDLAAQVLR